MNQTDYEKRIESMREYLRRMNNLIAAAHDQLDEMERELVIINTVSPQRTITPIIEVA